MDSGQVLTAYKVLQRELGLSDKLRGRQVLQAAAAVVKDDAQLASLLTRLSDVPEEVRARFADEIRGYWS